MIIFCSKDPSATEIAREVFSRRDSLAALRVDELVAPGDQAEFTQGELGMTVRAAMQTLKGRKLGTIHTAMIKAFRQ